MILKNFNNSLSILPFYESLEEQNHRKSYAYGETYPLYVPMGAVPPFSIMADYYIGDTYDRSWGHSDFEQSRAWAQIQEESRTSSSDYSGWDSNDTNWDSDW